MRAHGTKSRRGESARTSSAAGAPGGSGFLSRLRRILSIRRIVIALGCVVLLVAGLGALYRFEPVRPVSTLMLGRWLTLQPVERTWVKLADVSASLRNSVLMSEDGQFCAHRGVDWTEFKAVVDDALSGEKARGASTLTMQTARNLFLWNSRSYVRKALEIPLAIYLDAIWPKRRIMEVYLNIAEWGDGIFGIEAAARHYFGVSAAELGPRQSALLATTLPNPLERNPASPSRSQGRVANVVQRRAAKAGGYNGCIR